MVVVVKERCPYVASDRKPLAYRRLDNTTAGTEGADSFACWIPDPHGHRIAPRESMVGLLAEQNGSACPQ